MDPFRPPENNCSPSLDAVSAEISPAWPEKVCIQTQLVVEMVVTDVVEVGVERKGRDEKVGVSEGRRSRRRG